MGIIINLEVNDGNKYFVVLHEETPNINDYILEQIFLFLKPLVNKNVRHLLKKTTANFH